MDFNWERAVPVNTANELQTGFDWSRAVPVTSYIKEDQPEEEVLSSEGPMVPSTAKDYLNALGVGMSKAIGSAPQVLGNFIRYASDDFSGKGKDFSKMFKPSKWTWNDNPLTYGAGPADILTGRLRQKLFEKTDIDERISAWGEKLSENNKRFIETGFAKQSTKALQFVEDVGAGSISLGTAIGLGMLFGPQSAGVAFGMNQTADVYDKAMEAGFDYDKARTVAQISGIAEGSLEFIGLHVFLKQGGSVLMRGIKGSATEFIQEFSQQFAEEAIGKASGLNKISWIKIISDAAYAGSIGAVIGGPSGVAVAIQQKSIIEKTLTDIGVPKEEAIAAADDIMNRAGEDVFKVAEQTINDVVVQKKEEAVQEILSAAEKAYQVQKEQEGIPVEEIPTKVENVVPEAVKEEFAKEMEGGLKPSVDEAMSWEEAKAQRDVTGDLPSDKFYYHVSPEEQVGGLKSKPFGAEEGNVVWLQKQQPQYTTEGYAYAIDPSKVNIRVAKGNTNAFVHEGDIPVDAIIPLGKLTEEGLTQKELHERLFNIKGTTPPSQPVKAGEPSPGSKRERGFVTTMKESEQVTEETKKAITELPVEMTTYDIYTDKESLAKAQERVANDQEGVLADIMAKEKLDKDTTTASIELMRVFREQGKTKEEVDIAIAMAEKGTKAGQFIQAFSILNKLSPDGVLVFAQREINRGVEEGDQKKVLTPEQATDIQAQAAVIASLPHGYQKVKEISKMAQMISDIRGKTQLQFLSELINIPRTIMASFLDFSFGGRQGLFLLPSFAKEWGSGFSEQFGSFFNEENYDALMDSVMQNPDYFLAEESGIAFTDIRTTLARVEENYMGAQLAEKIPIVGKGVLATQRAYTGMSNKMRMDVFSKMIKDIEAQGVDVRNNKKLLKQIATFVNAGTGRGGLAGAFQEAGSFLNAFLFSPRLISSRLTLLNPVYYVTREPYLRKQALKSLFGFLGMGLSILSLAKLMGLEVGDDWRSADFGKIKIGNTRIDVWGGFSQYIRMFGQLATGEYVSSTTGRVMTLGEGYKAMSRFDILFRQLESKEAPVFSLLTRILKQQDWSGKPVNIPKEVALRFIPMVIQDVYDLAQEDPTLIPLGILPIFGIGVQTYSDNKKRRRTK
jgi:hypothetical protein